MHPLPSCDIYGSCGHASCAVAVKDDYLPRGRGWAGLPFAELDGKSWPVSFAAGLLEMPEQDLRDLIRIAGLQPSGVLRMADFRRSGRQPKAYPAAGLIRLGEVARSLRGEFSGEPADNRTQAV